MKATKFTDNRVAKALRGWIFGILMVIFGVVAPVMNTPVAYAEPVDEATEVTEEVDWEGAGAENTENVENAENSEGEEGDGTVTITLSGVKSVTMAGTCGQELGSLGWRVCPVTEKISEAVDWLYGKIQDILIINPVEMKDGSPMYEIWKYFRGVTNIVFMIFLLVMVYSQLTGLGITNYGVKKALPKLIVAAILVNLSFVACSVLVDVSNAIGGSLRGLFTAIEEQAMNGMTLPGDGQMAYVPMTEMYTSLSGGSQLAVGAGLIAFESGAIWMLIPVALGAIVAVASGLITIALRQAVVALLIMVAPLAIVAYILPNTDTWFKKWRELLTRMLVFYPMFSLLFGASSLAGFAIITSATDGFGVLVGVAVQIFPLFFSWSLMKMSGTILGTINTGIRKIAEKPLAANRTWAQSRRDATRARQLARENVYTPSLYLRQFLSDRKVAREERTAKDNEIIKARGQAYRTTRNYRRDGTPSREGEYQARLMRRSGQYESAVRRDTSNMNEGLMATNTAAIEKRTRNARRYTGTDLLRQARYAQIDGEGAFASDILEAEKARGEMVDTRNAEARKNRMEDAMNAHMDDVNGYQRYINGEFILDKQGNRLRRLDYEFHFDKRPAAELTAATQLYSNLGEVANGSFQDIQYAAAAAAHAADTQAKIIQTKFQKYFELIPATRDVRYRLEEFSKNMGRGTGTKAVDNIDAIISGLRILNQRGDTDFIKEILDDVLDEQYGGLELGTKASQAIASFLMFDVKDADPYLRRFGKYINLETARRFDKNQRQKKTVDYEEYVKGYHEEPDGTVMYAKRGMAKLMEGTSLDGIERTALDNYDASLRKAYTDENGVLDYEAYRAKREEVDKATAPQFISANLKYLSGSEQISSAVKSKTGYMLKQNKQTGEYSMVPIWEDAEEAAQLFGQYEKGSENWTKAKDSLVEWYRKQTLGYLMDQTPAQILGLRSDYKEPLLAHLSNTYLLGEDGMIDEMKKKEHDDATKAIDADNFGETDATEIEKRRKAAKEALRMHEAGEAFRELLYKKGKLEQIEKSKRSGAANNAKDWVRELLLLDTQTGLDEWILKRRDIDETAGEAVTIEEKMAAERAEDEAMEKVEQQLTPEEEERVQKMMDETRQKQREEVLNKIVQRRIRKEDEKKREADAVVTPRRPRTSAYTLKDVAYYREAVDKIWDDVRGGANEYEEFYESAHEYLKKELSANSYVVKACEKYYEEQPNGDAHAFKDFMREILRTLTNEEE